MSSKREKIETILRAEFSPSLLEIEDQSDRHAGHREAGEPVESHFRVTLVSERFAGLSLLKQHQLVYRALDEILKGEIHALQLITRAT